MIKKFWTNEHNELVRQFINDKESRHNTFNKLLNVLNRMIDIVRNELNLVNDEDFRQECLLRLYSKILPAIHEDKLKASQHYIYISLRNLAITYRNKLMNLNDDLSLVNDSYNNIDEITNIYDARIILINYLDFRINKLKVINNELTMFLVLFKDYLIDNDFDERGFCDYYIKKTGIKKYRFLLIVNMLELNSEVFSKNDKGKGVLKN